MKRLDYLHLSLLAVITALIARVVFTPYQYHRLGVVLVRVNRITGDSERLTGMGWKEMAQRPATFVIDEEKKERP